MQKIKTEGFTKQIIVEKRQNESVSRESHGNTFWDAPGITHIHHPQKERVQT